ncbi:hypothetical protein [uncultured Roseobacter sp.]|uniref:hypothetical protein n=1 Tax=uncultured Roseobacter sp. TaxID=114847 RepID=UPI00261114F7|nr:hypothetical protein [uncultured Roseobacter sp.]
MINRRSFLAIASVGFISACAEPLLDVSASQNLRVNEVTVDVSQLERVGGRQNAISTAQVQRDVQQAVSAQLQAAAAGSRPVNVQLSLTSVQLVSPGMSLLVGGTSRIAGILQVKDAESGAVVIEPTEVFGLAKGEYAPGGIIGALAKSGRSPTDDYKNTVSGFAADVRKRLFGA